MANAKQLHAVFMLGVVVLAGSLTFQFVTGSFAAAVYLAFALGVVVGMYATILFVLAWTQSRELDGSQTAAAEAGPV